MHGGLAANTPDKTEEAEAVADARAMGASADQIKVIRQHLASTQSSSGDYTGVWPQHVEVVHAFLTCVSQWRTVPVIEQQGWRIIRTGFDYAGVKACLEVLEVPLSPELWRGLQIMEHAACEAWNCQQKNR